MRNGINLNDYDSYFLFSKSVISEGSPQEAGKVVKFCRVLNRLKKNKPADYDMWIDQIHKRIHSDMLEGYIDDYINNAFFADMSESKDFVVTDSPQLSDEYGLITREFYDSIIPSYLKSAS